MAAASSMSNVRSLAIVKESTASVLSNRVARDLGVDLKAFEFPEAPHCAEAWRFYERMGRPRYVVAPMVNQSEHAFRALCRRYGADLCYTPMINSNSFLQSPNARAELFPAGSGESGDRPLIAQFAGDDPETMAAAAALVQDKVDAVDINCGW
jgi:tRNA-dihydrouridine synthase 1